MEEPPPPPAPAAVVAPEPEPEPDPVKGAEDADLPEGKFGTLPGWLGWSTMADRDAAKLAWSAPVDGGQIVVLEAEDWATKPKPGRALRVLTRDGNLEVKFTGTATANIGCDSGQPVQVAVFSAGDAQIPEQAVWILPSGETAEAMPLAKGQLDAKRASWTLGPLTIKLRAEDAGKGRLEVFREGDTLLDREWQIPQDYGFPPTNFTEELGMPGVPVPVAGFQIDRETAVVVFEVRSMEGVHWEVFALRTGGMALAGDAYLYLCAS